MQDEVGREGEDARRRRVARGRETGCVGFLAKPLEPAELLKTIGLLLRAGERDPPRP